MALQSSLACVRGGHDGDHAARCDDGDDDGRDRGHDDHDHCDVRAQNPHWPLATI